MRTFEEYLKEIHAQNYTDTDDDMPDAFDNWFSEVDTFRLSIYADRYGQYIKDELARDIKKIMLFKENAHGYQPRGYAHEVLEREIYFAGFRDGRDFMRIDLLNLINKN